MHTAQSVPHSARRAQRAARAPGCLDNQVSAWRAARAQPQPAGGAARRATPTAKKSASPNLVSRVGYNSALQWKNGKACACSIILPSGHIVQSSAKRDRSTTLCAHSVRALLYSTLGSYSQLLVRVASAVRETPKHTHEYTTRHIVQNGRQNGTKLCYCTAPRLVSSSAWRAQAPASARKRTTLRAHTYRSATPRGGASGAPATCVANARTVLNVRAPIHLLLLLLARCK